MPKALIIRTAGTNCDSEMVRAFQLAGAQATLIHLDRLIADPALLDDADLIGFPGGFSYGDDVASGRVFAMRLRERLYPALHAAAQRGVCMIGACNGFQVLVQVGLLPGTESEQKNPERKRAGLEIAPTPTVALTDNIQGRFIDQWLRVESVNSSNCIWTKGLTGVSTEAMMLPIAHGEGRFVTSSPEVLQALESSGQVALRYTDNINGSQNAIAGICDPTGRIFGLMPHPERYLDWMHHPFATRLDESTKRGDTPGLRMFKNAVEAVTTSRV